MVKIRLTRTGKKHEPHYRIVAIDSRAARDAKYLEKIGYYNPRTKPPTVEYDKDILKKWIDQGAQMTDTVHDLFVREGVIKQDPKRKNRLKLITDPSNVKKKEGEEGDAPAEKPAETSAETPAEKPAEKTDAKPEAKPEDEKKADDKKPTPKPELKKEEKPPKDPKPAEKAKPEAKKDAKSEAPQKDAKK